MVYCGIKNIGGVKALTAYGIRPAKKDGCSSDLGKSATKEAALTLGSCIGTFLRGAFNEITESLKFFAVEAPTWIYKNTIGGI